MRRAAGGDASRGRSRAGAAARLGRMSCCLVNNQHDPSAIASGTHRQRPGKAGAADPFLEGYCCRVGAGGCSVAQHCWTMPTEWGMVHHPQTNLEIRNADPLPLLQGGHRSGRGRGCGPGALDKAVPTVADAP